MSVEPTSLIDELKSPAQRRLVADAVFNKYSVSKAWKDSQSHPRPIPSGSPPAQLPPYAAESWKSPWRIISAA